MNNSLKFLAAGILVAASTSAFADPLVGPYVALGAGPSFMPQINSGTAAGRVTYNTGYIGNLKSITLEKLMEKAPEQALIRAVKGMLPKNSLGRDMMRKLRVFAGPEHEHQAQQPQPLDI